VSRYPFVAVVIVLRVAPSVRWVVFPGGCCLCSPRTHTSRYGPESRSEVSTRFGRTEAGRQADFQVAPEASAVFVLGISAPRSLDLVVCW